ncbi:MAG TPA: hypothetical protein VFM41_01240 [Gaiella sp.]|nr:hypothetical protein [Gaiella sp.]
MWGALGLRLLRLANPVVRVVLGSRAHRVLSGRLVVVEYRGHLTGREYRIPLRYASAIDGTIVAIALRAPEKRWWRSFRPSGTAVLTLRGARVDARGALVEGDARARALAAYLARYPRSARAAGDAAVVVFERADG